MPRKSAPLLWLIKYAFLFICLAANTRTVTAAESELITTAPGSPLRFVVTVEGGRLYYKVESLSNGTPAIILMQSPLGILRTDDDFAHDLKCVSVSKDAPVTDSYTLSAGKQLDIHSKGVERTFTFENQTGALLTLTVRVYPDGVAFRYGFPGNSSQLRFITNEITGFHLPLGGRVWLQPYSKVGTWGPGYESEYANGIDTGTVAPGPEGWAMPALFKTATAWVLITEAGLQPNYFASHLEQKPLDGTYVLRPPEKDETYGVAPDTAAVPLPWLSPWRLILVSQDLKDLVQSNLVTTLSLPSEISDTKWIHPGIASWSWWSDMASPADYNKLTSFVDLAANLGWEYSTVDLGWQEMKNGDIVQLAKYAQGKKVGLFVWYNSGGKHNQVPDAGPRNLMSDVSLREAEMARIEKLGIKGIKVDFMQSDKQYVIGLYYDILQDAARHHLMVDFHGATIPRGWSRTFPNLLTMEAVSGSEQYWSDKYAENAQTINAIYPFTRNVIGSMDYTPMAFADAAHLKHHLTTNAHELALTVVFESGIQHVIDSATDLAQQPDYVKDFLRHLPAAWDESQLIDGFPGELAIMARRKGHDWYLAGINGEKTEKTIRVPLKFLRARRYRTILVEDGQSPREFSNRSMDSTRKDVLEIKLAPRGGFAAKLVEH